MRINWRNVATTAALGAGILGLAVWRLSEQPSRTAHVDESTFEVAALADEAVVSSLFAVARAELYGGDADGPEDLAGRRVFLCAYSEGPLPPCGVGEGTDLTRAVRAAAADLRRSSPSPDARLKMDLVVSEADVRFPAPALVHDVGLYGYFVEQGGERSWVLPAEVLEIPLYEGGEGIQRPGVDPKELVAAFARRNPRLGPLDKHFDYTRIRTAAWVENAEHTGILRTYRLHAFDQPAYDADLLLQRAVWAADYLISSVAEDGRIRYLYDPNRDRILQGYNMLRHGGTTYAMLQAYQRTGFAPYLEASRAAIDFLLRHTQTDERTGPHGGGVVRYVLEGQHIKLGGAGLGLLMLAEYQQATGDEQYATSARELALFLVSQQQEDGEFTYFAPLDPAGTPREDTSAYYPGEAIVGLMRWYALDPDPRWLETAVRGADWLIDVRDGGMDPGRLANDHWLMIGLSHLYAVTNDDRYLRHALSLAKAVEVQQGRHTDHVKYHRDYRGGYYEPPRSTPAATRGEGLVAVLDTCAVAGEDCGWVAELLASTIRHELQCQYTPDQSWWVPNRGRVHGAFNGGIVDTQVRNDFVQHNLSAMLGAERHLRGAAGDVLPGGPRWARTDAEAWSGLPASRMLRLRAATSAVRPSTPWEQQSAAETTPKP